MGSLDEATRKVEELGEKAGAVVEAAEDKAGDLIDTVNGKAGLVSAAKDNA
jgi:hypothetical protein